MFIPTMDKNKSGSGWLSRYCASLRSGDRIPAGGIFFAPIQIGPRAYPNSYTMCTGYFLGIKRPGHGVDQPPPTLHRSYRKSRAIHLLPLWAFVACYRMNFNFTFMHNTKNTVLRKYVTLLYMFRPTKAIIREVVTKGESSDSLSCWRCAI
jgi:hypothetical protein